MTSVRTANYLHAAGLSQMSLTSGENGPVIVTATLVGEIGEPGQWIIEAEGKESATAETRTRAIEMMGDMSLLVLGVSGSSLWVPPEIAALP